jgi:hypothetical protein
MDVLDTFLPHRVKDALPFPPDGMTQRPAQTLTINALCCSAASNLGTIVPFVPKHLQRNASFGADNGAVSLKNIIRCKYRKLRPWNFLLRRASVFLVGNTPYFNPSAVGSQLALSIHLREKKETLIVSVLWRLSHVNAILLARTIIIINYRELKELPLQSQVAA